MHFPELRESPLVTHGAIAAAQEDDELRTLLLSTTALQLKKILIPGTSVELY
jgi:hypothetical protein